jgi:hypothetical protein
MLHRVLPTFRERFCLTVWLDGTEGVNSEEDLQVCVCVCAYVKRKAGPGELFN